MLRALKFYQEIRCLETQKTSPYLTSASQIQETWNINVRKDIVEQDLDWKFSKKTDIRHVK